MITTTDTVSVLLTTPFAEYTVSESYLFLIAVLMLAAIVILIVKK